MKTKKKCTFTSFKRRNTSNCIHETDTKQSYALIDQRVTFLDRKFQIESIKKRKEKKRASLSNVNPRSYEMIFNRVRFDRPGVVNLPRAIHSSPAAKQLSNLDLVSLAPDGHHPRTTSIPRAASRRLRIGRWPQYVSSPMY